MPERRTNSARGPKERFFTVPAGAGEYYGPDGQGTWCGEVKQATTILVLDIIRGRAISSVHGSTVKPEEERGRRRWYRLAKSGFVS